MEEHQSTCGVRKANDTNVCQLRGTSFLRRQTLTPAYVRLDYLFSPYKSVESEVGSFNMPSNEWDFDIAAEERRALIEHGEEQAKKPLTGLLKFAFPENILQFAFGSNVRKRTASYSNIISTDTVIVHLGSSLTGAVRSIAEGFTQLTNSLVNYIMLPPPSALFPLDRKLDEKFVVLRPGPNYDSATGCATPRRAIDGWAVVMAYGGGIPEAVPRVVNFVGIVVALYTLAMVYQLFSKDPIIEATVQSGYCERSISEKVLCVNCTSWQDGREERMR
ncbi:hypothetical protein DL764_003160 [Monosporascus ibericus]|uniref:Uncharacterized protein n=1 Tax=Monosporascus ibericus TaxID=155417 RepID=A0A4Q4TK50_9PEZI|nr:hypothetical protein DL764_003160 [Monosporascus ibericus]